MPYDRGVYSTRRRRFGRGKEGSLETLVNLKMAQRAVVSSIELADTLTLCWRCERERMHTGRIMFTLVAAEARGRARARAH